MKCQFCGHSPCTCLDDFYGPITREDWVDSLNAARGDLAYGRELEDNQVIGFAGARWATAWDALEKDGITPQWDEESGKWHL